LDPLGLNSQEKENC